VDELEALGGDWQAELERGTDLMMADGEVP
jgi:hypothetical protein